MSSSDARFDEIVAAYLEAAGRGEAPSREQLLAQNPEYAGRLGRFLDNEEWLRDAVAVGGAQGMPPTVGDVAVSGVPARLRYVGDYEVLGELGRGGMGVVYRARQISLRREVALKVVLTGEHASEDHLRRFRAEAETVANLDHPNIVPVYEVGVHQGLPYFSMKLIEGRSLAQADLSHKPRELAALMAKAARAVHHAHQRGVLHRDLKPGNILLDQTGEPHIADFGLARRGEGGGSLSGSVIGTPEYMPPEQALGKKGLTTAADVYSLGATLYAALAQKPPFSSDNPEPVPRALEILSAVVNDEPPPLPAAGDLGVIALKCLSKEPARRYESAAALADDLERWLAGEPILARPASSVERLWRWCQRNRAAAALVLVSFFSLLCLFGAGAWFNSQLRVERDDARTARDREVEERRKTADALRETRRALAGNRVSQAFRAWQDHNASLAHELLNSCPATDRLWEWHFVRRLCDGGLFVLDGHTAWVSDVAFSPDGQTIASASSREVILWDARSGEELRHFPHAAGKVAFSPDGKRLATFTRADAVKLYDVATGRELLHLGEVGAGCRCLAWSPDGTTLATGSRIPNPRAAAKPGEERRDKGAIRLWNATTGRLVRALQAPTDPVNRLAFSPDGTLLAAACDRLTVRLWDVRVGQERRTFTIAKDYSVCDDIVEVEFSPDGRYLAAKTEQQQEPQAKAYAPGNLCVWEVDGGKEVLALKMPAGSNVAFSPECKHLVLTADRVHLWELKAGKEVSAFPGCGGSSPAYSPDGQRFAVTNHQRVCIRDVEGIAEFNRFYLAANRHTYGVDRPLPAEYAVEHRRVEVHGGGVGTMEVLLHVPTGKELTQTWQSNQPTLEVSSDGHRAALRGDALQVLDVRRGEPILSLAWERFPDGCSSSLSPDGLSLAVGTGHSQGGVGEVQVWDVDKAELRFRGRSHTSGKINVVWHSDSAILASACANYSRDAGKYGGGEVKVWDAQTGTERLTLRGQVGVTDMAFSPDGMRLATGSNGVVKIWDAQTGQELLTLKNFPHSTLGFHPDGRLLSWSHVGDGLQREVWVCDGRPVREARRLECPKDHYANAVIFHPDGQRLAIATTASEKPVGSVQVWEYHSGRKLFTIEGTGPSLAVSPDGKLLAGSVLPPDAGPEPAATVVQLWDADTGAVRRSMSGHKAKVIATAFSPDGGRLASLAVDAELKVWNVASGRETLSLVHPSSSLSHVTLAFHPDGRRLAASDGTTWDLTTGKIVPSTGDVVFPNDSERSPDGRYLAVSENDEMSIVDLRLDPVELAHRRTLTRTYPQGTDLTRRNQAELWLTEQAADAEKAKQWSAAAYHLERLYRNDPTAGNRLSAALAQADESPLTQAIRRNANTTDAGRIASAVGQMAVPGGWSSLMLLPPNR